MKRIIRITAGSLLTIALAAGAIGASIALANRSAESDGVTAAADSSSTSTSTSTTTTTTTTTTLVPPDGLTSAERTLTETAVITGELTPKSVVWSGGDRFFAQNMMYTHTIGVYDRSFTRVALLPDTVRLADWGFPEYEGEAQGSPVEAAFSPDGRYAYVSQYEMFGPGFSNPGHDNCEAGNWDPSFVYRVDVETLTVDQVIKVGAVPKYVAVSPDGTRVLVTNWCSFDMSVIDTAAGVEVARIPIGRYPRGVVVSPDSSTAYVAIMGGTDIAVVDLATNQVAGHIGSGGVSPRHIVQSPDGAFLYVTLNRTGDVVKIDTASGTVVARVATGQAPRSMDISDDGTALYVVNYESASMSKVRTEDMTVLQELPTHSHPIGITYDADARQVWVACYSGALIVFTDAAPAPAPAA